MCWSDGVISGYQWAGLQEGVRVLETVSLAWLRVFLDQPAVDLKEVVLTK